MADRANSIGRPGGIENTKDDTAERVILDLGDVTLVDADVVRFLSAGEQLGVKLVRCLSCVREWILRERVEGGH